MNFHGEKVNMVVIYFTPPFTSIIGDALTLTKIMNLFNHPLVQQMVQLLASIVGIHADEHPRFSFILLAGGTTDLAALSTGNC